MIDQLAVVLQRAVERALAGGESIRQAHQREMFLLHSVRSVHNVKNTVRVFSIHCAMMQRIVTEPS